MTQDVPYKNILGGEMNKKINIRTFVSLLVLLPKTP